jgi:hypothetical protein
MPVDLTELEFGADPVEGEQYVWRVSGIFATATSKGDKLRLVISATIVDDIPQAGYEASFPAYLFIYDDIALTLTEKKRKLYAPLVKDLARMTGIDTQEIRGQLVLPSFEDVEAGERNTDFTQNLLNTTFEASAKWQEPSGEWEGRWQINRDYHFVPTNYALDTDEETY